MLRLRGRLFNNTLINEHAPTEEKSNTQKDVYYVALQELLNDTPANDIRVILGDLNAQIGKKGLIRNVCPHTLHERSNNNGLRAVDFATSNDLVVASTLFPRKDIHKQTWMSPSGKRRTQIDHVLIASRHFSFLTKAQRTIRFNNDALKDDIVRIAFADAMTVSVEAVESGSEDTTAVWNDIKSAITTAASGILVEQSVKNVENPWYDEECRQAKLWRKECHSKCLQLLDRGSMTRSHQKAADDLMEPRKTVARTYLQM